MEKVILKFPTYRLFSGSQVALEAFHFFYHATAIAIVSKAERPREIFPVVPQLNEFGFNENKPQITVSFHYFARSELTLSIFFVQITYNYLADHVR